MIKVTPARASLALLVLLAACGPDEGSADDQNDGGGALEGQDAGPSDSPDAGQAPPDAGLANPLGTLGGACGQIDAEELGSPSPFIFENTIDFGNDPYDDPDDIGRLTEGGQEIVADGNAGGSSLESEIFAFEVLARCEGASLLKTETEVTYIAEPGKITDLLVLIDAVQVGVSVTRAFPFPRDAEYPVAQAKGLLEDKLADVLLSTARVTGDDVWAKQILHVITDTTLSAQSVQTAWTQIDAAIKGDTIVVVTISEGSDDFLY